MNDFTWSAERLALAAVLEIGLNSENHRQGGREMNRNRIFAIIGLLIVALGAGACRPGAA